MRKTEKTITSCSFREKLHPRNRNGWRKEAGNIYGSSCPFQLAQRMGAGQLFQTWRKEERCTLYGVRKALGMKFGKRATKPKIKMGMNDFRICSVDCKISHGQYNNLMMSLVWLRSDRKLPTLFHLVLG